MMRVTRESASKGGLRLKLASSDLIGEMVSPLEPAIEGEKDVALLDSMFHAGPSYFRDLIPEYGPADVGFRTRHCGRRLRN